MLEGTKLRYRQGDARIFRLSTGPDGPGGSDKPPRRRKYVLLKRHGQPGPNTAAPPVACKGPHGRRLGRGLANRAACQRQRGIRGALCSLFQGSLRRSAASVPADTSHRARQGAAPRHGCAHHRDRIPDRLEQPRDVTSESPSELRAREQASAHQLDQVPHCFVSAACRPDLKIAVSEKRRQEAGDRTGHAKTEIRKCQKASE